MAPMSSRGQIPHFRITLEPLTASHLHCTAGSSRSFTVIRKDAGLYCGPRLRKGEVFAYVGLPQNLKDLKRGTSLHRHPEPGNGSNVIPTTNPHRSSKSSISTSRNCLVTDTGSSCLPQGKSEILRSTICPICEGWWEVGQPPRTSRYRCTSLT